MVSEGVGGRMGSRMGGRELMMNDGSVKQVVTVNIESSMHTLFSMSHAPGCLVHNTRPK